MEILLFCALMAASAGLASARPIIVFLLSGDQDSTGLSLRSHPDVEGSKHAFIQTPNIEKLAAEGMRFSAAYAPSPVCASTRISLQTGTPATRWHRGSWVRIRWISSGWASGRWRSWRSAVFHSDVVSCPARSGERPEGDDGEV